MSISNSVWPRMVLPALRPLLGPLFAAILIATAGCGRPKAASPEIRGDVDAFATRIASLGGTAEVRVDLAFTNFTDEDLAATTFPDTVTEIDLRKTKVTDEGLVHLKKVKNLYKVNLADTRVSDAGLHHLRELPNLCYLELRNSLVSRDKQVEIGKELIPRQNARITQKTEAAARAHAPRQP